MHDPTDEVLMAYADGLLDEAQCRALEQRLASDEALRARLEPFILTGRPLGRLYEKALADELPVRLLDTILSSTAANIPAGDHPRQFAERRHGTGFRGRMATNMSGYRLAGALAAGVVIGIITGWLAHGELRSGGSGALIMATARGTFAKGDLARALDETTTGSSLDARNETGAVVIRPELTFAARSGYCRQYAIETQTDLAFAGIACRTESGEWRVEVHAPAARRAVDGGAVRPASGGDPPAAVAGALDQMAESDPLTVQQERELIRNGWRPAK